MPYPLEMRFVQQAEKKLARKLPLGYVAWMCCSNGGEVSIGTDVFQLYAPPEPRAAVAYQLSDGFGRMNG